MIPLSLLISCWQRFSIFATCSENTVFRYSLSSEPCNVNTCVFYHVAKYFLRQVSIPKINYHAALFLKYGH